VKRQRAARVQLGIASLLIGLLAALAVATPVWGHDHHVPRVNLHVNEQAKRLHTWSYSWVSADGPGRCVGQEGDGTPTFRPGADVHLHSTPRIVFRKAQRPRRVHALASDHLAHGHLGRKARRLDLGLRPRERDGHRVWVAKLHARVRDKLFVDLTAHWRDVEACGGNEEANWSFSLRRG
jgi:hypothetical protein